jgi:hypothetical protein
MSRARNIKPGFFRNADLVELPVETRLLFIGLWGLADREGRMEDRPKQIKMEVYPADSFDVDFMLAQLHVTGFIERYEINENKYIEIVNFTKHQNPHRDEKASTIPAPCKHDANTVAIGLNPSSLIPESLFLNPDSSGAPAPSPKNPRKNSVSLPAEFQLNEVSTAYAQERKLNIADELLSFANWHTAKGSTFKDWQAAWRTWCDKAVEFGRSKGGSPPSKQSSRNSYDQQAREAQERIFGHDRPDEIDITPADSCSA